MWVGPMKAPVVIIGMGELGGVFVRGLSRLGHPVFPVVRDIDVAEVADAAPEPALVLVTVGEGDLADALAQLPASYRDRVGLVQNELLPRHWREAGLVDPTVMVVWFEKKPAFEPRVLIPSPIHGPRADLMEAAVQRFGIPVERLEDEDALERQLVAKNLYILVNNVSGLEVGGTVDALWSTHRALADRVAEDVLAIQFALIGRTLEPEPLIDVVLAGVRGARDHQTMGRTAPDRLRRAIATADELGLAVPELRRIADAHL